MKKIKISICLNLENKDLLEITEEQFIKNKKSGTLDKLFEPVIFFCGEGTFSGPNWALHIYHEGCEDYTINILPRTKWDVEKKCNVFIPGINSESMEKLYNFILLDIQKNSKK